MLVSAKAERYWVSLEMNSAGMLNRRPKSNLAHHDVAFLTQLVGSTERLRRYKIKKIRQVMVAIAGSKKIWEVVGRALPATVSALAVSGLFALLTFIGADATKDESLALPNSIARICL